LSRVRVDASAARFEGGGAWVYKRWEGETRSLGAVLLIISAAAALAGCGSRRHDVYDAAASKLEKALADRRNLPESDVYCIYEYPFDTASELGHDPEDPGQTWYIGDCVLKHGVFNNGSHRACFDLFRGTDVTVEVESGSEDYSDEPHTRDIYRCDDAIEPVQ
jgi:hypothetical protein